MQATWLGRQRQLMFWRPNCWSLPTVFSFNSSGFPTAISRSRSWSNNPAGEFCSWRRCSLRSGSYCESGLSTSVLVIMSRSKELSIWYRNLFHKSCSAFDCWSSWKETLVPDCTYLANVSSFTVVSAFPLLNRLNILLVEFQIWYNR